MSGYMDGSPISAARRSMLHPPTKPSDTQPGALHLSSSSSVARDPRARPVAEIARSEA
jgi:hypothetical protein